MVLKLAIKRTTNLVIMMIILTKQLRGVKFIMMDRNYGDQQSHKCKETN